MLMGSLERLRALPRLLEVVRTLLHHGMHDLVHSVGIHGVLERTSGLMGWSADEELAAKPLHERLPLALEALGPAFVKLGQVLASRVDLLPPDWVRSLDRLHNHASPVPFESLEAQLLQDLDGPIDKAFASFDREPAASGSVAQVHKAVLRDGTPVAVKIRRPGVVARIEADVLLLEALAQWWEEEDPKARQFQPVEVVAQLRKSLAREIDFAAEARGQERFAESFVGQPEIIVPRIHAQFTRASLLVMDWIDGVPATDIEAVDRAALDRHTLAAHGANMGAKMVLLDGFFHADPHPGNVFYLPGNRMALIDFGMVGWISAKRRDELVDLLAAVAGRDAEAMRDVLIAWADGSRVSLDRFADDLGRLLHLYQHAELRDIHIGTLISEIAGVMRDHHLVLPADLALLFKALISLEGLGARIDPNFRLVEHITPHIQALLRSRWEPGVMASRLARVSQDTTRALGALPRLLDGIARNIGEDGPRVRLEMREVKDFARELDGSVNRLTIGLVTAALIIGSSIIVAAGRESLPALVLGSAGFVISFANSLWLIASIRRSRRG